MEQCVGPVTHQRVAAARLTVLDALVASWELALIEGQDVRELEGERFFGYGVDAGTGCFVDADAVRPVAAHEADTDALESKDPIRARARDWAGFVVNALLVPYLLAAVRMLEGALATAADIDKGMEAACAHPMGPLRLCDLIGLDTVAAIAQSMYEEYKEPLYAAPPLLRRMVDAGLLGRKSGRGFFHYGTG